MEQPTVYGGLQHPVYWHGYRVRVPIMDRYPIMDHSTLNGYKTKTNVQILKIRNLPCRGTYTASIEHIKVYLRPKTRAQEANK